MAPERNEKTAAEVEAYRAERERQRAEGQQIAKEAIARRKRDSSEAAEKPPADEVSEQASKGSPEDKEPFGEYVHVSKEQVTANMLRDLDERFPDPGERETAALSMAAQEAADGNWEEAEAALTRVQDLEKREIVYVQLQGYAQQQGEQGHAEKYGTMYENMVAHRSSLSRIADIEEPNTREDAIAYEATEALRKGQLDFAEHIVALGQEPGAEDLLRRRIANPLLHEVSTDEAREALIDFIGGINDEPIRATLLARYVQLESEQAALDESTTEVEEKEKSWPRENEITKTVEKGRNFWLNPRVALEVGAGALLSTAHALGGGTKTSWKNGGLKGKSLFAAALIAAPFVLFGWGVSKGISAASRSVYEKYKGYMPDFLRKQTDRMMEYAKRSRERNKRK